MPLGNVKYSVNQVPLLTGSHQHKILDIVKILTLHGKSALNYLLANSYVLLANFRPQTTVSEGSQKDFVSMEQFNCTTDPTAISKNCIWPLGVIIHQKLSTKCN